MVECKSNPSAWPMVSFLLIFLVRFSLKPESFPHIPISGFETKLPLKWKHQRGISWRGRPLCHPTHFLASNESCPHYCFLRSLALLWRPQRWASILSLREYLFHILIVFTIRKLFLRVCPTFLCSISFHGHLLMALGSENHSKAVDLEKRSCEFA